MSKVLNSQQYLTVDAWCNADLTCTVSDGVVRFTSDGSITWTTFKVNSRPTHPIKNPKIKTITNIELITHREYVELYRRLFKEVWDIEHVKK